MSKALKTQISEQKIKKLAFLLAQQDNKFDINLFLAGILCEEWENLELKQRISKVALQLGQQLSGDFSEQVRVLQKVDRNFSGLFHLIFAAYVARYGTPYFDVSMQALAWFTENSSAEFAVRGFINQAPEKAKSFLLGWSKSENEHLRRLASEGVRPKLPWAEHIQWIAENPDWVLPIIQSLKADKSRYVQKSVANLINDFSKTKPEWVMELLAKWNLTNPESRWIAKHALRTLLKQSDKGALQLLGYREPHDICVQNMLFDNSVKLGEKFGFEFTLVSNKQLGWLRLEYALHFLRKNGTYHRKVFKISEFDSQQESRVIRSFHDFKQISTRNYQAGIHRIEIMVNGETFHEAEFELIC